MSFRGLGASGLNVPVIGLGTANFRGDANSAARVDEKLASRLIDMAIDHDASFIDTADSYPGSEEVIGKAIGKKRNQVLIATKAGQRSGIGANQTGASRHHLIDACEQSLRRLGTDYIDLYQISSFDGRTPVEETLSALNGLINSGKVRYIGCSNYAGWQLMKALSTADRLGWARFVSHQIAYSLAARDCEWELLPLGADQNVGTLVWGPLAGGLLGGKFSRSGTSPSYQHFKSGALDALPENQLLDIIDCLGEVSREVGAKPAQVALYWLLQRPTISTVFVGASSAEQWQDNLNVLSLRPSGDQLARLDEVSARPAPYPYAKQRADERHCSLAAPKNVRVDKAYAMS
jgi:aryl-alcohol dehydrogenase-like predicted oxidoreductase